MVADIRRSCRWLLFSFCTLLLATGVFASQSPFSLKIAQPNGAQKAGSELRIRITVTNTSNREITFITSAAQVPEDDFQYELTVRDERGQSAPPSAFMRTRDPRLPMYSGSRIGKSVRPGESFVDEVNVTRFFDLSRPGKYSISVARPNPPRQNLGDGKVQSNSVTVTVVAQVGQVGASAPPFSVTLQTPANAVKVGEPVVVRLTTTNLSDHEIKFARGFGDQELDFDIEVRDAAGGTPPITEAFRKVKEQPTARWGSYSTYALDPGKSFDDDLVVTKLYDLNRPGTYTISVVRGQRPLWQTTQTPQTPQTPQTTGNDAVQSNVVTLTIQNPDPHAPVPSAAVLDLAAPIPSEEQGYYPGLLPGGSGGGATGGWHPGAHDTEFYRLPLTLEILRTTTRSDGALVFEILLRNDGNLPFDLPSSQNLTKIENPTNKSRHVFFLKLQPVGRDKNVFVDLGSAATASSAGIPGSSIRIEPGGTLRVLLLGATDQIKRSIENASGKLQIKANCNEWILDDNRFFLRGESDVLDSVNAFDFALRDGKPMPVQP